MPWVTAIHANHFALAAERLGVRLPLTPLRALGRRATATDRMDADVFFGWIEALEARTGRRDLPWLAAVGATEFDSPLFHLASALPTAADGLEVQRRYFALLGDMYSFESRQEGDAVRLLHLPTAAAPRRPGLLRTLEFELCTLTISVAALYGPDFRWSHAWFGWDVPETYAAHLGCPVGVVPGGAGAELVVPSARMASRTARPNATLAHFLQGQLERQLSELPPPSTTLAERLSAHLRASLPRDTTAAEAARALSLSERTLERRLAEEGTTFRAVLEGVRRALAVARLAEAPTHEVAARLGYADDTSFSRAFKRWFGVPPGQHRRL
jgi:AraC-like DNA-binding protein